MLRINEAKSSITNLSKHSIEFLGFKYKLTKQNKKLVGTSHIFDKAIKKIRINTKKALKSLCKNKVSIKR